MSLSEAQRQAPAAGPVIIYDGECPFCSTYVRLIRLRESAGPVRLVNARGGGERVEAARARGFDLDEGMVLIWGDRYYQGADCIHMLSLLTTPAGLFNRFNAWVFRSPGRARVLYPVLRAGRNAVLRLLGRPRLEAHGKRRASCE